MNTNSINQSFFSDFSFSNLISTTSNHVETPMKIIKPVKTVVEREMYDRLDSDEIIHLYLKYLPFKDRLVTIPQVSYQFYKLSKDFCSRCYHLHHLIHQTRKTIIHPGSYFSSVSVSYVLNFHETRKSPLNFNEEKISLYRITFPHEEISYELFKSAVELSFESMKDGSFDLSVLNHNIRVKSKTECIFRVKKFLIFGNERREIDTCKYGIKEVSFIKNIADLLNLDEKTFEMILGVLLEADQEISKESFDLMDLKNKIFDCFKDEERNKILSIIEKLEGQFQRKLDESIEIIMNDELKLLSFKKGNIPREISQLLSLPRDGQIKKLKEWINWLLELINFKFDAKKSLFLIEKHGKGFTTIKSKYASQLLSPDSELGDEHRFFAERIIVERAKQEQKNANDNEILVSI